MPHRKPHRKSRLGCKRCKTRRTKCDEVHPICGGCKKQGLDCDFLATKDQKAPIQLPPVKIPLLQKSTRPISYARASSTSLSPSLVDSYHVVTSSSTAGDDKGKTQETRARSLSTEIQRYSVGAMTMNTPSDRLIELRLMHHFVNMTTPTFFQLLGPLESRKMKGHLTWSNWMTQLALQTPGLMDALLGFSAFNLRNQNVEDKALMYASHNYMTKAIAMHKQQLRQGVDDRNAEVIFATSSLIAFIAITSQRLLMPVDEKSLPLHWFRPWQGVRAVLAASWRHIKTPEIMEMLMFERNNPLPPEAPEGSSKRFHFLLDDLDRESVDKETVLAYERSVEWLSRIYDNPSSEYIFKFTSKVEPRFVKLLEASDPRTLTIVGYFFMCLETMEKVWWLPWSAKTQFWTLMDTLPEQWKPRMAWAASEIGGNLSECEEEKSDLEFEQVD